jgi:hypothetical protein
MFFYGMIENGLKNPLDQHGYSSFASKRLPVDGIRQWLLQFTPLS